MVDLSGLISGVASLHDSFKESFEVFKRFLLEIQLTLQSVGFVILFLLFVLMILAVLSSPAFIVNLIKKQKSAITEFFKENKNPRDWIGRS